MSQKPFPALGHFFENKVQHPFPAAVLNPVLLLRGSYEKESICNPWQTRLPAGEFFGEADRTQTVL